jgi:hypothetical protein
MATQLLPLEAMRAAEAQVGKLIGPHMDAINGGMAGAAVARLADSCRLPTSLAQAAAKSMAAQILPLEALRAATTHFDKWIRPFLDAIQRAMTAGEQTVKAIHEPCMLQWGALVDLPSDSALDDIIEAAIKVVASDDGGAAGIAYVNRARLEELKHALRRWLDGGVTQDRGDSGNE